MPKFSQSEREIINERLLAEGHRLFVKYGVRKVTIQEITRAVGIAAGSFYAFYPSKEDLYLHINIQTQDRIFAALESEMAAYAGQSPQAIMQAILGYIIQAFSQEPIITMLDGITWEAITRKATPALLEAHLAQDVRLFQLVEKLGVQFRYPQEMVAKTIQALMVLVKETQRIDDGAAILHIITEGTLHQLLAE